MYRSSPLRPEKVLLFSYCCFFTALVAAAFIGAARCAAVLDVRAVQIIMQSYCHAITPQYLGIALREPAWHCITYACSWSSSRAQLVMLL